VDVQTQDTDSGIYHIKLKIVSNGTDGKEFHNGEISGNITTVSITNFIMMLIKIDVY